MQELFEYHGAISININININMNSKSNSNLTNLRSNRVNPAYSSIYYNKNPQQSTSPFDSTAITNQLAQIMALNQQLANINHHLKASRNLISGKSSISAIQNRIIWALAGLANKNQQFQKLITSRLAAIEHSVKTSSNQHQDIEVLTQKIHRMEDSLRQTQKNQAKLIDCLSKMQELPHHQCPHYHHSQKGQAAENRNNPILIDESRVSESTSRLRMKQMSMSHGTRNQEEYYEKRYHTMQYEQGLSQYNHKGLRNYQARQLEYGRVQSEQRNINNTLISNKSDVNSEKAHRMNYLLNYLSV